MRKIFKNRQPLPIKDKQVGNFIFHVESLHIKVKTVSDNVTFRISTLMPVGQFVLEALKSGKHDKWLENYASVQYNALCVVPDEDFMCDVSKAVVACAERHLALYGVKENISKKEDDRILKEEKDFNKAVEEAKGDGVE